MAIYAVQPGRATVVKIPDPAQTQPTIWIPLSSISSPRVGLARTTATTTTLGLRQHKVHEKHMSQTIGCPVLA